MPSHLRRHDEPGHTHFLTVSCYRRLQLFHDEGMKQVVVEAMKSLQQKVGVCLLGYVIMPEHLHALVYPHRRGDDNPIPIGRVLQAFKQYVGRHGKSRLRDVWRRQGRLWSEPLNQWAHDRSGKQQVMNTRAYDRNVTTEEELHEKLDYCHKNPITRGLVARAEDWPWSSFRFYERFDAVLAMDWDRRWPIIW